MKMPRVKEMQWSKWSAQLRSSSIFWFRVFSGQHIQRRSANKRQRWGNYCELNYKTNVHTFCINNTHKILTLSSQHMTLFMFTLRFIGAGRKKRIWNQSSVFLLCYRHCGRRRRHSRRLRSCNDGPWFNNKNRRTTNTLVLQLKRR